jgi:hypothetical protein
MAACGATETIACSKSKSGIPSKAEDRKSTSQYSSIGFAILMGSVSSQLVAK